MGNDRVDPRIRKYLKEKLVGKVADSTIQPAISRIRKNNPSLTLNAAAEVFAKGYGESVQKYFNERDRDVFKTVKIEKMVIKSQGVKNRKKIIEFAKYDITDKLLKANIDEINKTYTYGCYTASFILCRKVIENLIVHHLLKKRYPGKSQQDRSKYFDFGKNRYLDFSVLLYNLKNSANDFTDKKLVERICDLADGFKEDANDMTHSIYHIASKKEIDAKNYQQILDLISALEKSIV